MDLNFWECAVLGANRRGLSITNAFCLLQFSVASQIIKTDGFGSLYKGLSAGLLRQATYTTARLGIFNTMSEELKKRNDGKVCL